MVCLFNRYDLAQGPGHLRLFQQSGHTPPLEEPERFDQTLLAWVHRL
jgi:pimeloyl-ACP methyl ester carboxylesterase